MMKKFRNALKFLLLTVIIGCFAICGAVGCGSGATYKVSFFDYDGTEIIAMQTVMEGASAHAPVKNPTREGYEFTGWDKEYNKVTGDLTVTAQYARLSYTVTFYGYQDAVIGEAQTVYYGDDATAPTAPNVDGLIFVGWRGDYTAVKENLKIYAEYRSPNANEQSYTVTFYDFNGQKIGDTQTVAYGNSATAPQAPSVSGYVFVGWRGDYTEVKGNVNIYAHYRAESAAEKSYTVTFYDIDEEVIGTAQTVAYGDDAVAPTAPTVSGKTFIGWKGDYTEVVDNVSVYAIYADDPTQASYTVTFYAFDGSILDSETVNYGESATAPSAPTVAGYNFVGWRGDYSNVKSDVNVYAYYNTTPASEQSYSVTFYGEDGSVIDTQSVAYGQNATAPTAPTVNGYVFEKWLGDYTAVTDDVEIYATYKIDPTQQSYNVSFYGEANTLITTVSVPYGESATAPTAPTVSGKTFIGWKGDYTEVVENVKIYAIYKDDPTQSTYTVTFYDYSNNIIGRPQKVLYGENATAPNAPTIEGMDFVGWRGDYTEVVSDVKVYAEYRVKTAGTLHLVTFEDADGGVIKIEFVETGLSATMPEMSVYKKNHYFTGWSAEVTNITASTVIKPLFATNEDIDGLKIYKKAGEDFNTLLISDIQTINTNSTAGASLVSGSNEKYQVYSDTAAAVYNTVDAVITENAPDYLVLMGDNIYSRFDTDDMDSHWELMKVMDSYKIPWSIIFGNHDGDVADAPHITRAEIIEVYSYSKYFLFEQEDGAECGDYVVSLIEEGSDEIETQFVFMYTHESAGDITNAQLEWYERKMEYLIDGETVIPSIMFAHIPFQDMYYGLIEKYNDSVVLDASQAFDKLEIPTNDSGDFGVANSYTYSAQHGLFSFIKRYQSTQSVFFGHNHSNNFSVEVDGVRLTHSLKTGFYDQEVANRNLNGATLLTLDGNGTNYSIYHKFINGTERSQVGGSYTLNRTLSAPIDNDYLFLDHTSSLGSVAGAKKITLAEGESAYIEFDVVDGIRYNSGSDQIQAGFRVHTSPITASWPGGAPHYTYYMINNCYGDATTTTVYNGVLPLTYSYYNSDYKVKEHIVESVFQGGKTLKFVVYSDATYAMFMKNTGEDASEYKMFRSGPLSKDISNGFYLGFTFNRDITVDNVVISGSDYYTGYNFAGVKPLLNGMDTATKYTTITAQPGHIYGAQSKVLTNATDTLEMEFTLVQPQATISSAKYSAFCVTSNVGLDHPAGATSSFMVNSNHVYTVLNVTEGSGVTGELTAYENSFNDYTLVHSTGNPQWTGSMLFRSYVTYKFTLNGAGEFAIYMKSALKENAVYEKVLGGTLTGISNTTPLYIGYLFYDSCEVAGVTVNGSNKLAYHNAVISE